MEGAGLGQSRGGHGLPAISLFSGAMGMDLGLERAGFEIRLCVESDPYCAKTIGLNRPDLPVISRDIRTVPTDEVLEAANLKPGEPALIAGGPPCQSFSTAGRRGSIRDERGSLFQEFARVVSDAQPRFVLMENVRGILSAAVRHRPLADRGKGKRPLASIEKPGSALKVIRDEFDTIGYDLRSHVLNAADFGTPQSRVRVFLIGSRSGEEVTFPRPTHDRYGRSGLKPWGTLRDALADLNDPTPEFRPFSEERLRYLRHIPPGGNWRDLPSRLTRQAMGGAFDAGGGKVGFYRRLSWDRWSPTLPATPDQKGTCLCHPKDLRPLSVREYMRIQQFPDNWKLAGGTSQKYKQVGNAVPVGMARAVGQRICRVARADGGKPWSGTRAVQRRLVYVSADRM